MRRLGGSLTGNDEGLRQLPSRLEVIRACEPLAASPWCRQWSHRLMLHCGDYFAQSNGERRTLLDAVQVTLGLIDAAYSQQERGVQGPSCVRTRRGVFRETAHGRQQIAVSIGNQRIFKGLLLLISQAKLVGIDHRGVVQSPLDDVDCID